MDLYDVKRIVAIQYLSVLVLNFILLYNISVSIQIHQSVRSSLRTALPTPSGGLDRRATK